MNIYQPISIRFMYVGYFYEPTTENMHFLWHVLPVLRSLYYQRIRMGKVYPININCHSKHSTTFLLVIMLNIYNYMELCSLVYERSDVITVTAVVDKQTKYWLEISFIWSFVGTWPLSDWCCCKVRVWVHKVKAATWHLPPTYLADTTYIFKYTVGHMQKLFLFATPGKQASLSIIVSHKCIWGVNLRVIR